jgi:hypothetical protein
MEKIVRIVKKGEDESNLLYWLSLSEKERMAELEKIRQEVNLKKYGIRQGLQRVYRIIKRA